MKRTLLFFVVGFAASANFVHAMDQEGTNPNIKITGPGNMTVEGLDAAPNAKVEITTTTKDASISAVGNTAGANSTVQITAQGNGSASVSRSKIGDGAKMVVMAGATPEQINALLADLFK